MRRFAISDIHGCVKTFWALLEKVAFSKEDELYLLGDYIDRGPNSKGVIDLIWKLQDQGHKVQCLRGNHEQMMLDAREFPAKYNMWYTQGGKETLQSFNRTLLEEVEPRYWDFLNNLPYYFEVDQYLLVHAGFNFKITDPLQDQKAMMWIRNWYDQISKEWLGKRIIVHGHTPTSRINIDWLTERLHSAQVLVIDNGCAYDHPDLGTLAAFELNSQAIVFQSRMD